MRVPPSSQIAPGASFRGVSTAASDPFRELAEVDAGITCAVHRGLVSGALRALGSDLDAERLDAFVEPELCIARLRPSRRAESS